MQCPICKSSSDVYKELPEYSSFVCQKCHHIYIGLETIGSLSNLYDYDFYENYMGIGYHDSYKLYFEKDFKKKLELIKNHIPLGSKILEVGCGPGYFSNLLQNEGYKVTGVELNLACKLYANNKGVEFDNFICEDISEEKCTIFDEKFDAVISWATIEHVVDPNDFISVLKKYTKDSGLIFIDTGVTYKAVRVFDYGYTKWLQPPYHLHVFSYQSLLKAGALNNLSPLKFFKWYNSGGLLDKSFRLFKILVKVAMNLTSIFHKRKQGFIAVIGLIIFKKMK